MKRDETVLRYFKDLVADEAASERYLSEMEIYLMDVERDRRRYRVFLSFWWGVVLAVGVIALTLLFASWV